MRRNNVTTRVFKLGKNKFLVINIHQNAEASSPFGNALVTNQANVRIFKDTSPRFRN